MVRVIKRGQLTKTVYHFICSHCKSELEAEEKEVTVRYGDQRDPYTHYSITCPVCNQVTGTYNNPKKSVPKDNDNTDWKKNYIWR